MILTDMRKMKNGNLFQVVYYHGQMNYSSGVIILACSVQQGKETIIAAVKSGFKHMPCAKANFKML